MTEHGRTIIIGLDGVPFGMIEELTRTGVMPNTAKLVSQGIFKKMHSSIPEVSSVAWSSMITGRNPAEHKIFGFTDLMNNSYRMTFPNFNDLKAPPFWEQWKGNSVIMNVPSTYPVHEMSGVHIAGFVAIDFAKSIHPKSIVPTLKEMDYRLDVDSQKAHKSIDLFLKDVEETIDARIRAYRYLFENQNWQTFMLVFTATDRLLHFLWDAYEDKNHKYHSQFLDHFGTIDGAIGEISNKINDDDLLVMLSDHGFERLDYDIYINHLLRELGLLHFKHDDEIDLKNICVGTKTFALDPARIYINFKDKYPCGTVETNEAEEVLGLLENIFNAFEVDGRKVIKDIYRKNEIYSGPYIENAPDMVLVSEKGFNLKASLRANKLADKAIFTGKHTQHDAFLSINGIKDENIVPEVPTVADVKSIMEKSRSTA
jgi:predicted AlkP superfamily phosphohydrolase/phosphomutase